MGGDPTRAWLLGLVLLLRLAPSLTWAQTRDRQSVSPGAGPVVPDADLWIYSSLLTVPYSAVKGVVAVYGGLLGGVLYLFLRWPIWKWPRRSGAPPSKGPTF